MNEIAELRAEIAELRQAISTLTTMMQPKARKAKPPEDLTDFDRFWAAYPRKTSKQEALKAWRRIKPNTDLLTVITSNIEARMQSGEWTGDRKRFIPHPSTYLNQQRWNDEIMGEAPMQEHCF